MELEKDTIISEDYQFDTVDKEKETNDKHIRNGFSLALFSATMTSIAASLYLIMGPSIYNPVNGWALIDAAIMFLFAFGVYKRSRVAATLLVISFSFILMYTSFIEEKYASLLFGSLFLYIYMKATIAIFKHHKNK